MLGTFHVSLRKTLVSCAIAGLIVSLTSHARGGYHAWKFNELFSNSDGTIQFIELTNGPAPGETAMTSARIDSNISPQFAFPTNLSGNTANKKLLIATTDARDLLNALVPAVPPDYIMPDNFFSVSGDTLIFKDSFTTWDSFPFGALPLDGVMSLNRNLSTSVNDPTNFAGATGSIDLTPVPGDANGDGFVDIFDVNLVSSQWGTSGPEADVNDDGTVDIFDVNFISSNWDPPGASTAVPEPTSCALAGAAAVCCALLLARRRG